MLAPVRRSPRKRRGSPSTSRSASARADVLVAQRDGHVLRAPGDDVAVRIDAKALNEIAAAGDELVDAVERERAVARVVLAIGRVDDEEARAVDGHVGVWPVGSIEPGVKSFSIDCDARARPRWLGVGAAEVGARAARRRRR